MNTFEDPPANTDNSTGDEVEVEVELVEDDSQNISEAEKSAQLEWKKWESLLGKEKAMDIYLDVLDLDTSMEIMIRPVLDNIKKGDYQLLIGDDASARIPTLIMREFINQAYEQAKQPPILTTFIAGSRGLDSKDEAGRLKQDKIQELLTKIKESSPSKNVSQALIVTEYIETGHGLKLLIQALQAEHIAPTVLAMKYGFEEDERNLLSGEVKDVEVDNIKHNLGINNVHIGIGQSRKRRPFLHGRVDLSGVMKDSDELHARATYRKYSHKSMREEFAASMAIARLAAKKVAAHLMRTLLKPDESE